MRRVTAAAGGGHDPEKKRIFCFRLTTSDGVKWKFQPSDTLAFRLRLPAENCTCLLSFNSIMKSNLKEAKVSLMHVASSMT